MLHHPVVSNGLRRKLKPSLDKLDLKAEDTLERYRY